jgi:starch synthase (maltosyl-transferring)
MFEDSLSARAKDNSVEKNIARTGVRNSSSRKKLEQLQQRPSRVIIDRIVPEIDGGKFAAKYFIDEPVSIKAHVFTDGHDHVKARLLYRHESQDKFSKVNFNPLGNDEWQAEFQPETLGRYYVTVEAAIDRFGTWKADLKKRIEAGQNVSVDLKAGTILLRSWFEQVSADQKGFLTRVVERLEELSAEKLIQLLDDVKLEKIADEMFCNESLVRYQKDVPIFIEPKLARFSSWYEFFPRSASEQPGKHGTFKDAEKRLEYVKRMGFNVVYFPPIHPIGEAFRKGKNNSLTPDKDDVGSPWAIGGKDGGHKSIHSKLGTLKDFDRLVSKARDLEIEIAMDIAFQCSPDHPYVKDHPEWFKKRPDGTIQYAENPPKKYQDIYPFDFECKEWRALWYELKDVVQFWVDHGVKVFRVDNPHTKPFHFWEWLISEIRADHPEVIFLAEAFTRPKVMAYLAKSGFSQSYTYFSWRNTKWELTEYLTELTKTELKDYFSPNFWPNTPDILPEPLQNDNRSIYMQRLILAATLASSYGIYGPTFELMEYKPRHEGSEEYLDSEKYQLRNWDLSQPKTLAPLIRRINMIRNEHPALQSNRTLRFHQVSNDSILAYSKQAANGDLILTVVNLDPHHMQSGMVELPLTEWKIDPTENFQVHDLLTDSRYFWNGWRNYVELNPHTLPAHIFTVRRHVKTAKDFDYF